MRRYLTGRMRALDAADSIRPYGGGDVDFVWSHHQTPGFTHFPWTATTFVAAACCLWSIACLPAYMLRNATTGTATILIVNNAPSDAEVSITNQTLDDYLSEGTQLASTTTTKFRVPSGGTSSGLVFCSELISFVATVSGEPLPVEVTGDGTGSIGFDSGSVGTNGERLFIVASDFNCGETIRVQLTSATSAVADVFAGTAPDTEVIDQTPAESSAKVVLRIENATASAADVTLTPSTGEEG